MSTDPTLLALQGVGSGPTSSDAMAVTDPLNPPKVTSSEIVNFDPDVYDLSPESHLSRFLKVLLGDAGVGQLRKRMVRARLEQTLYGTRFLDLDRYAGGLFGLRRLSGEKPDVSPYTGLATGEEWDAQDSQDAVYRARIEQFLKALPLGGTVRGIKQAAQALFGVECEVYETYVFVDDNGGSNPGGAPSPLGGRTYGDIEDEFVYYENLEGMTYGDIEGGHGTFGRTTNQNRQEFIVVPKREVSMEELYEGYRTLALLKPAEALLTIDPNGIAVHSPISMRGVSADSTYWEVVVRVAPKPGKEAAYTTVDPAGRAVQQPKPVWTRYQGEAWSYNDDINTYLSYTEDDGGNIFAQTDYDRITQPDGKVYSFTPDLAIQPPIEVLRGRMVSDAVLVSAVYSQSRDGV